MRIIGVLSFAAVLAAPALAAAQPADNWIELPVNQAGVRGWYDVGTLHIQGSMRTIRMRFQPPGQSEPTQVWTRVDCASGASQTIAEFNSNGEPVPATDWATPVPGSIGSIIKDGVCNR